MKYVLEKNVRVRKNGALSFFVNVADNRVFSLETPAMEYVLSQIESGLDEAALAGAAPDFAKCVEFLTGQGLLQKIK